MLQAYRRYADFSGRANRSEFWLFQLFFLLVLVGASITRALVKATAGEAIAALLFATVFGLFALASLVPSLSVGFRRLHDIDRSAWWILLGFIPLLGSLVLLVLHVLPGTPGPNRFGPQPAGGEPAPDAAVFS
jgi:uncharacterized membrane protein YhaH (DUF805 family)